MTESPILLYSIIAAATPTLLYTGLIYWVDRYEKEPWWLLTAAFLWGAIPAILLALVFNSLLSFPFYALAGEQTGEALAASFVAPPVEETVKGLALLLILWRWRHEIDSVLDGIIYGAMVGMGFAMIENVYYFMQIYQEGGMEAWGVNVFMRGVTFGLNHALFSSMTGLGIAVARLSPRRLIRWLAPMAGWTTAVFLHFLHNAAVSFNNYLCFLAIIFDWGGIFLTLIIIIWALVQERRWIERYLANEVGAGTLTLSQYETACSAWQRFRRRWRSLFSRGPGGYRRIAYFYYRCSELAYKKHHYVLFQHEEDLSRIAGLRDEIRTLSRELLTRQS